MSGDTVTCALCGQPRSELDQWLEGRDIAEVLFPPTISPFEQPDEAFIAAFAPSRVYERRELCASCWREQEDDLDGQERDDEDEPDDDLPDDEAGYD